MGHPKEGASSTTPTPSGQAASSAKPQPQDNKNKGARKKDDGEYSLDFSEQTANAVLNRIRDGLEAHSQRTMLSAFDGDKMEGFLTFQDQIEAYFERYEGFRVHFRMIQITMEGPRAVVLAEFAIEAIPHAGAAAQRSSNQVRFELERGKRGWKIVDFRPRGFFS